MARVDCKVVLLGREYAGKTSLVERYLNDRWLGDSTVYQSTIGAVFGARQLNVDGTNIIMGIWDTAGSERFEAMSRLYYRGASAAVVCYDITNKTSFDRVRFWVDELQKHEEQCQIFLCGTKYDLVQENQSKRQVDFHAVTDFADELGENVRVYETSSKTGYRVSDLFWEIAGFYVKNTNVNNNLSQSPPALRGADLNENRRSRFSANRECHC